MKTEVYLAICMQIHLDQMDIDSITEINMIDIDLSVEINIVVKIS